MFQIETLDAACVTPGITTAVLHAKNIIITND